MVGIVGIAGSIDVSHHIALYQRVGLRTEGVDAGSVVHVLGVVVDEVAADEIVCHGARLLVPSPPHTDAGV